MQKFAKVQSTQGNINVAAFKKYCVNTVQRYNSLYSWYYMPASVHKVLMHGTVIIEAMILPLGKLIVHKFSYVAYQIKLRL